MGKNCSHNKSEGKLLTEARASLGRFNGLKHPSSGACVYLQRLVEGNVTGEVAKLELKDVSILRSDKSVSLFPPGSSKSAFVAAHYKTRLHSIFPSASVPFGVGQHLPPPHES